MAGHVGEGIIGGEGRGGASIDPHALLFELLFLDQLNRACFLFFGSPASYGRAHCTRWATRIFFFSRVYRLG